MEALRSFLQVMAYGPGIAVLSLGLGLLDASPDGWQRRRAAVPLAGAASLPLDDLGALVGRSARTADAAFLARTLTASGQLTAAAFAGTPSEHVVRRLAVRERR